MRIFSHWPFNVVSPFLKKTPSLLPSSLKLFIYNTHTYLTPTTLLRDETFLGLFLASNSRQALDFKEFIFQRLSQKVSARTLEDLLKEAQHTLGHIPGMVVLIHKGDILWGSLGRVQAYILGADPDGLEDIHLTLDHAMAYETIPFVQDWQPFRGALVLGCDRVFSMSPPAETLLNTLRQKPKRPAHAVARHVLGHGFTKPHPLCCLVLYSS